MCDTPLAFLPTEARHGIQPKTGQALGANLGTGVRARRHLDAAHEHAAVRVLDLDQRIGQGDVPLEDRQTDAAGRRAAGDAGRVRPRDDAGRLARRAEDAAQLRLEPDVPDAAALGAQLLGILHDRLEDAVIVRELARVAETGPEALLLAARIAAALAAAIGNQIAAAAGQREDLVAPPAARDGRRFGEPAPLERGQRARRGERMAVERELDERAARDHPVGAEQLEHILLALLAAAAARVAALDAAPAMIAAAVVAKLDDPIEADGILPRRTVGRSPGLSNAGGALTRPPTAGQSAAVATGRLANRGRIARISHRDSRKPAQAETSVRAGTARRNANAAPGETKGGDAREGPEAAAAAARRKTVSVAGRGRAAATRRRNETTPSEIRRRPATGNRRRRSRGRNRAGGRPR